ncbi:MAG: alkaline phosphatase family protein [Bacteroidetes bacterium]|nr:alkaline phosphatase family protein [Bacteroidota bacterium]MBM3424882.1 alkaline phosphatase family protein [Bacteroidota bacterium]
MRNVLFSFCFISLGLNAQNLKLVVGVVVDQMCYDYLQRFDNNFGMGGFQRFLSKGVNCKNATFNFVPTYTGPGHASIYTGTTPSNHGIVANDWYDRTLQKSVNCVLDTTVKTIGSISRFGMASPHFLETTTVSDQLKLTYPQAKVISLSVKDRSAILPGGHLSDGSYWFDFQTGSFITSSYFKESLPTWLTDFNAVHSANNYLSDWNLLLPQERYSRTLDDSPYERIISGKKAPVFPYTQEEIGLGNFAKFVVTPFANTQLTDLAKKAIIAEQLGKRNATDFLCISYSSTDIAGHEFGPYSLEVEDMYLRLNLELERLFQCLDREVGKKNYIVFLTADHAVVPVPQQLVDSKLPGGYFNVDSLVVALNLEWQAKYGEPLVVKCKNLNLYFNRERVAALGLNLTTLQEEAVEWMRKQPLVRTAVSAHQLDHGNVWSNWDNMLARGYTKERSGDVLFMLKPGLISESEDSDEAHRGTTHGTAYNYDTHVPLLWYGNGIKKGNIYRPIAITDIAATLVYFLELQRPASMTGEPIYELWDK